MILFGNVPRKYGECEQEKCSKNQQITVPYKAVKKDCTDLSQCKKLDVLIASIPQQPETGARSAPGHFEREHRGASQGGETDRRAKSYSPTF